MEAEKHDVTVSFDLWNTLVGWIVPRLEEMSYDFDFHKSLSGHAAYVGIDIEYLVKTIDDILAKRASLPGGTVGQLEKMRQHLLAAITPAYASGKSAAKAIWDIAKSDEERSNLMNYYGVPEDVMAEAWRRVPDRLDISQANWFVEGYCSNWAQLWFDYQISQL